MGTRKCGLQEAVELFLLEQISAHSQIFLKTAQAGE